VHLGITVNNANIGEKGRRLKRRGCDLLIHRQVGDPAYIHPEFSG